MTSVTTPTTTTTASPTGLGGVSGTHMGVGAPIYEGGVVCCSAFGPWCRQTKWRISSVMIERQTGICCQTIDTMQLVRIKDLAFHSACCCCGSCCTITVFSTDPTNPTLEIKGIPNGRVVYQQIRDAVNVLMGHAQIEVDLSKQK